MSSHLRRIIDLGSGATLSPGSARDLRYHDNRTFFAETQTSWVRLWVDWPTLQPDPSRSPDDPAGPGAAHLQAIDEQIRVAHEDGIAVALQLYRFPLWANGLAALGAQRNTDAEIAFAYPDRIAPAEWARYVAAGRDPTRVNPSRRALEFGVPAEGVGPGTAWARFYELAYARWHRGRAGSGPYVAAFELVNEPNFQLAPSLADSELGGRTVTQYDEFAGRLLDALDAASYRAGPSVAWAHHNYTDLERRSTDTRVQRLRSVLAGRWGGYVEGAAPTVFVTEGGVRLSKMAAYYPQEDRLAAQARSWQLGWDAHHRDDGTGAGIGMLAQYTTYAEPRFDAGLLDPWPAVVRRPAYRVWQSLPRYD